MDENSADDAVHDAVPVEGTDEDSNSAKKCRINFLDLSDEILLVILQNLDSPSLYNLSK